MILLTIQGSTAFSGFFLNYCCTLSLVKVLRVLTCVTGAVEILNILLLTLTTSVGCAACYLYPSNFLL